MFPFGPGMLSSSSIFISRHGETALKSFILELSDSSSCINTHNIQQSRKGSEGSGQSVLGRHGCCLYSMFHKQ